MIATVAATVLLTVTPGHPVSWASQHRYSSDVGIGTVRVDGVPTDMLEKVGSVVYAYGRGCVIRFTQRTGGKLRIRVMTSSRAGHQIRIRYTGSSR